MRTIDADVLKEAFEVDGYKSPYIARMIDACPTVGGWISVKDRLPESGEYVLVHDALNGLVQIMCVDCDGNWYDDRMRFYCNNRSGEITHWMKMPEAPNEGGEENDIWS